MHAFPACFLAVVALSGCATLPNGRAWGQDAIYPPPSLERLGKSAVRAAIDPMTWVPALGAAALQIDHADVRVSDWAIERTPVFGSKHSADRWSDLLREASIVPTAATLVLTPGGEEFGTWTLSKARGLAVEGTAYMAVGGLTSLLKDTVHRARPDGTPRSFPSAHASDAFALATLTSKNLDSIDLPWAVRGGLQGGAYTLAGATAWARVEGGHHFPSDVLVSAALSHFICAFLHDAFLGLDLPDILGLELNVSRESAGVVFRIRF